MLLQLLSALWFNCFHSSYECWEYPEMAVIHQTNYFSLLSRYLQGKKGSDHSPARATVQSQAFMCASAGLHTHCSDSIHRATANWTERKPELVFNEKEKHEQWRMNGPQSMSAGFSAWGSKEVVFEDHSAASTNFNEQEQQRSNCD